MHDFIFELVVKLLLLLNYNEHHISSFTGAIYESGVIPIPDRNGKKKLYAIGSWPPHRAKNI